MNWTFPPYRTWHVRTSGRGQQHARYISGLVCFWWPQDHRTNGPCRGGPCPPQWPPRAEARSTAQHHLVEQRPTRERGMALTMQPLVRFVQPCFGSNRCGCTRHHQIGLPHGGGLNTPLRQPEMELRAINRLVQCSSGVVCIEKQAHRNHRVHHAHAMPA